MDLSQIEYDFLNRAYEQALKSFNEGGLPIGAVLSNKDNIVAEGHNCRVQEGDPIAHGEMVCIRKAGRRKSYDNLTLFTTLSPCMMCAGTIVQFGISRVIVGEDKNFQGNLEFLQKHGVEVILVEDEKCINLMKDFIAKNPNLWHEDMAGRETV